MSNDPQTKWGGDRYYGVVVSNSGRKSLRWSPPFELPRDARAWVKGRLVAGDATLGFAVAVRGGAKRVLSVHPESARKIVDHYLELVAALGRPETEDRR
jgi:hypothetical protein